MATFGDVIRIAWTIFRKDRTILLKSYFTITNRAFFMLDPRRGGVLGNGWVLVFLGSVSVVVVCK